MLVQANVGFQEENSTPEGLERVMGVNSSGANELPKGVDFSPSSNGAVGQVIWAVPALDV
jgi:hypothetical protein